METMQQLITIMTPDGARHQFILPKGTEIRWLLYQVLMRLDLPLNRYYLAEARTHQPIALDCTIGQLFPKGEGELLLSHELPAPPAYSISNLVPPSKLEDYTFNQLSRAVEQDKHTVAEGMLAFLTVVGIYVLIGGALLIFTMLMGMLIP